MPLDPTAAGPARNEQAHEDKCRRCGSSCHVAVPTDLRGTVVVPGLHCEFLVAETGGKFACTVYQERFARAPWCHHADVAAPLGYLADDCPYGTPPGQGKIRLGEAEFAQVWPEILRKLRSWGVPSYINQQALLLEVTRRTGRTWTLDPWPGDAERLRLRCLTPLALPTKPAD